LAISAAGLIATMIPALVSVSYVFGIGAIIWWLAVGIYMLSKQDIEHEGGCRR